MVVRVLSRAFMFVSVLLLPKYTPQTPVFWLNHCFIGTFLLKLPLLSAHETNLMVFLIAPAK